MTQPMKKTNYHHGNLKQGLVDTALFMLETQKPDQISLRAIARHLGVSQTAVYSHFKDKTALIAEIAAVGFDRQFDFISDRIKDVRDPYKRVEMIIISYMQFAFQNRALFQVMFSRDVQDLEDHKGVMVNAGKPYSLFAAAWSRYKSDKATQTPFLWSMVHGQTLFMCDPKFGPAISNGRSPLVMAREAISVFE